MSNKNGSIFNNELFNADYRKNLLKSFDVISLNEYLKYMEKLSKKGDMYLQMYNEDIDFLLNMNNEQNPQDTFNLLMFKPTSKTGIMTENINNTEGIFNKLKSITDKIIEINKIDELKDIMKLLKKENDVQNSVNNWISQIRKYCDIVINCESILLGNDMNLFRNIYFKEILRIISHNPKFSKETFNYLFNNLKNEKHKLSYEIIQKCAELRSKKGQMTLAQYKTEKGKLMEIFIKNKGLTVVYVSKLVEKMIRIQKKISAQI